VTRLRAVLLAGLAGLALAPAAGAGISFQFDYTYDGGFFTGHPDRQAALEEAAERLAVFTDDLDPITPGGSNWWKAGFYRPDTGNMQWVDNPVIPADTLRVYAGGRDLGGSVGRGGPGSYSVGGSGAWCDTVETRGEDGVFDSPETDFGPWGGSVTFTNASNIDWYFGLDPGGLTGSNSDFLSVAMHELGHVLGIGTAESWDAHVAGGVFTGPAAVAEYGGNVPVDGIASHWDYGTMSEVDGVPQEAAMDPDLTQGTRKVFTDLDFAGLADVGWEVPAGAYVWCGRVGTTWSAPSNWSDGGPPDADTAAAFDDATFYQPAVGVGGAEVRRIEFRSAGWTVAGPGTLTVHGGGGGSLVAGTNTVAAPVVMADDATWTVAAAGTLALTGGFDAGGFTVVKDGEGLLVISGPQNHAEGSCLDILCGTVEMNSDASGTGLAEDADLSICVTGATLTFGCNQHLDTLEIGDGGLVSFTGAGVVVVRRLIMNGTDLGATTLTPEPATLALVALGAGVLLARRRRR
jgi:hypothetical protein